MREWFTLLTDRPSEEIDGLVGGHPNEAKKLLAADIVAWFQGADAATTVRADWDKQFAGAGRKKDPDVIDEITLPSD